MKQTVSWFLVFMVLFSASSMVRSHLAEQQEWVNPYSDVTEDMWSYQYITELNKAGILPDSETFNPMVEETRGDLVMALYNMDRVLYADSRKDRPEGQGKADFTDVKEEDSLYEAVRWAYEYEVVGGTSETTFSPDLQLTRQQACAILGRYANLTQMSLIQVVRPDQFVDSLYIQDYARSYVTACQMAGVVKGHDDGYFYPDNLLTQQECAAMIYRLKSSSEAKPPEGVSFVNTAPGAYDALYNDYVDIPFVELVPQSAEAPITFFDQTVFIGDSVSLMLKAYCNASGALSKAQFLCAGSMSATNMLTGQILPEYPVGSGQHPAIEDSVAACGAKVVYIMLGMDNIGYLGIDRSAEDMVTVINNILAKSPNITIILQSVTPMADSSTSWTKKLNNDVINGFNEKMRAICHENKWYYLNVAEVFKDQNGYLIQEYCSDYGGMGMHFTYSGTKVWVEYLKTHVPNALLSI